jgi:SAM-dependent methyltransferase
MRNTPVAEGAVKAISASRDASLRDKSVEVLLGELIARLADPASVATRPVVRLLEELRSVLDGHLETAANRFSVEYVRQLFGTYYGWHRRELRPPIEGSTFIELGCGAENPLATAFVFLLLGAHRAHGVDDSQIIDSKRAVLGLAKILCVMLLDPHAIVAESAIPPQQILNNLKGFDLGKLRCGDVDGINHQRLDYRKESVLGMSFADGYADMVCSSAFLEHVPQLDVVIAELARISKSGAVHVHNLDFNDHGIYDNTAASPITFLTHSPESAFVRTCNRYRQSQLLTAFASQGFELRDAKVYERYEPCPEELAMLVGPFARLPTEDLVTMRAVYTFRKV